MNTLIITHLLQAATHGGTRNIPHVSTLIHVIVHAHIEQIIRLVPCQHIHIIVAPCKTMTMDRSLTTIIISRKHCETTRFDETIRRSITQIHHTQIRVVTRILVHTVRIVWRGTVTVAVPRLTILGPAALGGLELALVEVELG